MWNGVKTTASAVWGGITNIAEKSWNTITTAGSYVWDGVKKAWSTISDTAKGIWAGVKTTASSIWGSVKTSASGIWAGVQTSAKGIWSGVQTSAKGIWAGVKTTAEAPWKSVGNGIIKMFNGLIGGLNKIPGVKIATLASLAVGTTDVPFDMFAQIHQGEAVIPKTFMDGVRSGELSIGRNNGGGSNYYVTVNVEGSVTAENDLAVSIAEVLYNERKTGRLAV